MELHATIHEDSDGSYWAEVKELPGCFASGQTLDELTEGLREAIDMCMEDKSSPSKKKAARGGGGSPRATRVDEMKLVTA